MDNRREDDETEPQLDARNAAERRTLRWVLGINLSQVLLAGTVGIAAESTGLLGAALDNLGDAAVYVVSLYAVGRTVAAKARAARLSGVLLIVMALMLLGEIIRRYVTGSDPIGWAMILTAVVNAATNLVNLRLLRSHRERGVHLKASWIFTTNDMIANLGIVASGIAVMLFKSPLPDLLIGLVVAGIVIKGGWEILERAREARRGAGSPPAGVRTEPRDQQQKE
jgi:Co/Zn/Cd efflux system component